MPFSIKMPFSQEDKHTIKVKAAEAPRSNKNTENVSKQKLDIECS